MARKKRQQGLSYRASLILGCVLIGLAGIWFLWIVVNQQNSGNGSGLRWTLPGFAPAAPEPDLPALQAHGITLAHAPDKAALSQSQAVYIAAQNEPSAAAAARNIITRYALVSSQADQLKLNNTPAWIIWYQSSAHSSDGKAHDLYVVLDANSGAQLLSLWI